MLGILTSLLSVSATLTYVCTPVTRTHTRTDTHAHMHVCVHHCFAYKIRRNVCSPKMSINFFKRPAYIYLFCNLLWHTLYPLCCSLCLAQSGHACIKKQLVLKEQSRCLPVYQPGMRLQLPSPDCQLERPYSSTNWCEKNTHTKTHSHTIPVKIYKEGTASLIWRRKKRRKM